jgi:hypothetical protein
MALAAKIAAPVSKTAAASSAFAKIGPNAAVTTVAKPPPAAPNYATLMAQASTQASKLAASQIAAQVKAITDQQAAAHATASAQAAEINRAALAAATFLSGLGDRTQADYHAAVDQLGGLAGGYTGALRDTAQASADAAQAQLAGISGNTQQITNRGPDLANLLYGVSGAIPANALEVQGLGATAASRALPAAQLSYGQQQALGEIGAGNTAADALNSQIATIRATLPTTTSTYLTQFEKSAQDQITNARNATSDYWTQRNIKSQIAGRTAAGKRLDATAKAKAKADALKAQPILDVGRSKLTGLLTDQFGHSITKTVKGVQFLQTTPGFHFDNTGHPVADPKSIDPAKVSALAAEWSSHNHYRSDSAGNAIPTSTGAYQPLAPYVLDPNDPTGHTVMPRGKPTAPFIPKIDKTLSAANHAITYWDSRVGQWVQPKDAKTGLPIPYDPNKPLAPRLFNSNGYAVVYDPNTRTTHSLVDDNNIPLPMGAPKTPPPTHFGGRYPGADGFYHVYNTTTAVDKRLSTRVPAKVAAAGTWQKIKDAKTGQITFYNPTTRVTQNTPFTEAVPQTGPQGTYSSIKSPDGKLWRINSVTNKVVKTTIPWPTSASGSAMTIKEGQDYTARIENLLVAASTGRKLDGTKLPIVRTRATALEELRKAGYLAKGVKPLAMAILNAYYPLTGAGGKNWIRVTNPALGGG